MNMDKIRIIQFMLCLFPLQVRIFAVVFAAVIIHVAFCLSFETYRHVAYLAKAFVFPENEFLETGPPI
jgi:hypothetical protein